MAKYSATQQWTKPTEHTAGGWTMEAGAVIYRTCATLRELAQEIEERQNAATTSCAGHICFRSPDHRLRRRVRDPRRARRLRAARRAAAPSAGPVVGSAAEPTPARPERSGRVFFCPFPSESCPAPGLEDRAKRTERRAARSSILGFRPETPGKRANLAELEALGPGNRARDRRETAFRAAKSRQQRAEPGPRSSIRAGC